MYEDLEEISPDLKEKLIVNIKKQLEFITTSVIKDEEEKKLFRDFADEVLIEKLAQKYVEFFDDEDELNELLMLQDHPLIPRMLEFQHKNTPWLMDQVFEFLELMVDADPTDV